MINISPIGKAEGKLACRECFFFPQVSHSFTLARDSRFAFAVLPSVRLSGLREGKKELI